jgi:hypothetical protein
MYYPVLGFCLPVTGGVDTDPLDDFLQSVFDPTG